MTKRLDLTNVLLSTAHAASANRRMRDALNAILAEAGEDSPRATTIRRSIVFVRNNAHNALRNLDAVEAALDGGAQ